MQKIGASTTTADSAGEFSEGNAAQGVYATLLRAEWLNTIQRELVAIVENSGLGLDPDKDDQVLTAIRTLMRDGGNSFANDTGIAGNYIADYTPAFTSPVNGMLLRFRAKNSNTGESTFKASTSPAKAIVGLAGKPLQGGEIVADGNCTVMWWATANAWVLLSCSGGALQVPEATQSSQAVNLGQALSQSAPRYVYTNTSLLIGTYLVDTSAGSFILTLPRDPLKGDSIRFIDVSMSWDSKSWTLARNGKTIMKLAEDMKINVINQEFSVVYNGADWRLF